MNTNLPRSITSTLFRTRRSAVLAMVLIAGAMHSSHAATDCPEESTPNLSLQKFASFRQLPGPVLQPVRGYPAETVGDSHYFFAHFLGAGHDLNVGDGVLRFPNGHEESIDNGFWGSSSFPSTAAVDAFAPAGSYTVLLDLNGGIYSAALPLRNYWPQPAMVVNVGDTENIDPSRPLVLRLNAWPTSAPQRLTMLVVFKLGITITNGLPIPNLPIFSYPRCGDPIPGAVDSLTIPAGVLAPDQSYDCFITRAGSEILPNRIGGYATSQAMVTQTRIRIQTGQPSPDTPPTVAWISAPQEAAEGQRVTFSIQAAGHPTPTIQWLKDGQVIAGANTSSHTIPACSRTDAGRYVVRVTNPAGTAATPPVTLTVVPPPTPPIITKQPTGVIAKPGQRVALSVAATADPAPQFQWRRHGVPLAGATNTSITWNSITEAQNDTYDVIVFNRHGTVASHAVDVVVVVPPAILSMPGRLRLEPLSTLRYPPATLAAEIHGTGPLFVQWLKNGVPIPGATSRQWTIQDPTADDAGVYSLIVSNAHGAVARVKRTRLVLAPIPVLAAPVITKQPTAQVSRAGTLTLTVGAANPSKLTFQWYRSGPGGTGPVPIPGATNPVHTVPLITNADAGWYRVQVSRRYPFPDRTIVLSTTSAAVEVDVTKLLQSLPEPSPR